MTHDKRFVTSPVTTVSLFVPTTSETGVFQMEKTK